MPASINADSGGEGTVDQRTGGSPDPNAIAKGSHQMQTVLNGHTSRILNLEALLSKLIKKNNLKT